MKERLIINKKNVQEIERIGSQLGIVYQRAFAGEPWNERSRCDDGFSRESPGTRCSDCGEIRTEAYDIDELVSSWSTMIADEDALMQIAMLDDRPVCATIARPTNTTELYLRKYQDVAAMEPWLSSTLPGESVWIEDTFADRQTVPRGNLRDRAAVLGQVALNYGGLPIATRTKEIRVIAATMRDMARNTRLYLGSEGVGVQYETDGQVPDTRTFLVVEGAS